MKELKTSKELPEEMRSDAPAGDEPETEEDREILDMLKNIAEQNQNTNTEPLSPEMFENGVIGKSAREQRRNELESGFEYG